MNTQNICFCGEIRAQFFKTKVKLSNKILKHSAINSKTFKKRCEFVILPIWQKNYRLLPLNSLITDFGAEILLITDFRGTPIETLHNAL